MFFRSGLFCDLWFLVGVFVFRPCVFDMRVRGVVLNKFQSRLESAECWSRSGRADEGRAACHMAAQTPRCQPQAQPISQLNQNGQAMNLT